MSKNKYAIKKCAVINANKQPIIRASFLFKSLTYNPTNRLIDAIMTLMPEIGKTMLKAVVQSNSDKPILAKEDLLTLNKLCNLNAQPKN